MGKKRLVLLPEVLEFLQGEGTAVQIKFWVIAEELERDGQLFMPHGRKLERNLFEIRVNEPEDAIRVFYVYEGVSQLFGVHAYKKGTQKTPLKELRLARSRRTALERRLKEEEERHEDHS
jgi:phage-related protein